MTKKISTSKALLQDVKNKHMNKHIKGFNMSKIKHMRKKSRIFRNKFNDNASEPVELVYMIRIFSVLEKIPIDYFFQLFSLFSVIFEFKHIICT